jgi:hypothetical protein
MEEKSSTISPASVQSDEHTTSLSLTRRESSVDHITNLSTLEIPQSQIPTVSSSSDTNPPISVPALFYESPKIPQTVNWSPVAAGEVSGDKREPAGQLGHTSVYIPSSYTRRHETVVTKVVPSRKPLPPTPVRAINNKSQPEVDTYTDTCAESKEIVKANDLSDETLTSAINSQRSSIRQTGLQLPVSTFTPTSRSENVQENVMTSDEESNVNERQLPPILAQTIIPGLEIAHRPPARVQTVAHRDRGPQPWARGQQPVESSEVHMLDTHPWNRKNDDSASTISRKRRYFFNFKSRSEKPTPTPLPASLELCFSSCGSNLILWCSKDAAQIIRIRHPFRSGQRYSLDLPESMDGKTPNTSIRYLASSGETIVALVHIGNVRSYSTHALAIPIHC